LKFKKHGERWNEKKMKYLNNIQSRDHFFLSNKYIKNNKHCQQRCLITKAYQTLDVIASVLSHVQQILVSVDAEEENE